MSSEINHYYLQQMGIDRWVPREKSRCNNNELNKLALIVANCTECPLHKSRTHTVFSRGNPQAKIMIVGEAPGFYEDQRAMPFVGKAGQLLNLMLKSVGLKEEDVYIANILKCRPPDNRDPLKEEIDACTHYLTQQIQLISPQLLLALGRFAGQFLAKKNLPMNKLRQENHRYNSIPCLVSYHPAYLLRNPADKKKAYLDLLQLRQFLN